MIYSVWRDTGSRPIDPEAKKMIRQAGTTGAVGIEIALAFLVGYLGGQYLDEKFGTAPYLKWFGLIAGLGAAVKALVRVTRQYKKQLREEDAGTGPTRH